MEEEVIRSLEPQPDPVAQQRALAYLEQLKNSDVGLQFCVSTLTSGTVQHDRLKFFCFQVIEHYIKNHYENADPVHQVKIREFLSHWIQLQCLRLDGQEPPYIRNKAAQIFSMVFVRDYPHRWTTFFLDLIETLSLGTSAVDNYVRVLKAIDLEVADRDILRTQQEIERNGIIKNTMRETCVEKLVASWYQILKTYESVHPDVANHCLEVIGAYVSWIDITLIANDQFVQLLVELIRVPQIREAAVDCLHEIISKGMDPFDKMQLIESLVRVLQQAGVLEPIEEDETDFTSKLSRLVNGMGLNLTESYHKISKAGTAEQLQILQDAIERKVPLMLAFLRNDYDDVSLAVVEFAKEYIHLLKLKPVLSDKQMSFVHTLLLTVTHKLKFDDSYSFGQEGEDEATFQEYRKQLKVLFDNLAAVNKELVLEYVTKLVNATLQNWRVHAFQDVEVAILLLYYIGEAIPASGGNHFSGDQCKVSAMRSMMHALITCGVSSHPHPAVTLQYLETVARYDKFFACQPEHIPALLITFLGECGMRHSSKKVRSRCAYLFSRFVKSLKIHIQPYTKDVLAPLQELLLLGPVENGNTNNWVSQDDQLFLYEAAGVLIVSSNLSVEVKASMLGGLIRPVLGRFQANVKQLMVETNEFRQETLAQALCNAMAVTSRTSKAFSNQQSMKSCGCVSVYVDSLQVFLMCLQAPCQIAVLQSGVRQFLHRMVVCLEEELLPYIPQASEGLLKHSDLRSIQEYVPLIVQIIGKFKKAVVPFLQQVFMPIVTAIFTTLALPVEPNDEEAKREQQLLQRNYYQFIAAIVSNNVSEVLNAQDSHFLEQVMMSIIRGAVDFPDPVAQKTCFSILRKLVDLWGEKEHPNGFTQFIYKNVVPACFMAPMKNTFDLSDAQTLNALAESAACMKTILQKHGNEFESYLRLEYLPTLNISPERIEEYCCALKSDSKVFKSYVKVFFQQART